MSNPYGVRRASNDDLDELIDFAVALRTEEALQPVSRDKVAVTVARLVAMDGGLAGVIAGEDGIEASIGLEIDHFYDTEAEHLAVRWLGTGPMFRRKNHGARLLGLAGWAQAAISEAAGRSIPLFAELLTTRELSAKLHLYSRSAQQVGATFSVGLIPTGAFSQRHAGDDPYGGQLAERKRRHDRIPRPSTRP